VHVGREVGAGPFTADEVEAGEAASTTTSEPGGRSAAGGAAGSGAVRSASPAETTRTSTGDSIDSVTRVDTKPLRPSGRRTRSQSADAPSTCRGVRRPSEPISSLLSEASSRKFTSSRAIRTHPPTTVGSSGHPGADARAVRMKSIGSTGP